MDRLPTGFLEELIEARAYEKAYAIYQQYPKASGGLIDDVKQIEFRLVQEAIDRG